MFEGRVGQLLAGRDDVALQQDRRRPWLPVVRIVQLRADRDALVLLRLVRIVGLVDQPEFQRRGRAEHADRFVRILHARQLHDDAVRRLARDDRLGDAELIDAIAQRRDVLLDGDVLAALELLPASCASRRRCRLPLRPR